MVKLKITSKEMSLRNLATDITSEIRNQIKNQNIVSIPMNGYLDENYAGTAGVETVNQINEITERVTNLLDSEEKNGLTHTLTFGMWKRESNDTDACEDISLRVGESPVINPPWQFNELDDVRSNTTYPHMGRVYLTYIYSNFPILTFKPGREKLNANILTFFTKTLGTDHKVLNNYIRSGGDTNLLEKIVIGLTSIKNVTLGALEGVLSLIGVNFGDVSKFITFKPAMKLYRNLTNNLLREFAANLGLLDLTDEAGLTDGLNFDIAKDQIGSNAMVSEIRKDEELNAIFNDLGEGEKVEDIVAEGGTSSSGPEHSTFGDSTLLSSVASTVDSTLKGLASSYRGSFPRLDVLDMIPHSTFKNRTGIGSYFTDIEEMSYLPFLCQSNISISETFSNSTKEHPVSSEINSMSDDMANKKGFGRSMELITGLKDSLTGGGKGIEDSLNNLAMGVVTKIAGEAASTTSELGAIMNGDGRMAIPEVWGSSNYSRSYSVDFKFWSPTGDIVSIFENVYIPYLLLLVLSAPLQTGYASYVSPFIIKVFSKGLFSIDMGMIESLSVTRGDGQNDRTKNNFPRSIKVSVSIKDLAPVLMLSLGNGAFWKYKRANGGLSEYIATMCNLSIADRYDIGRKFNSYMALLRDSLKSNFSLHNIGYNIGNSFLMRPFVSWNKNKVTVDTVKTKNIYI